MIVPEIDTPGHTNAALASYAELNSSEEAPALYEGTEVGFSTLWINSEITYQFLEDVIRELAALTPTPYIHIGGDEARSTPEEIIKSSSSGFRKLLFHMAKPPLAGQRSVKRNFCRARLHSTGSAQAIRKQRDRAQKSSFPRPTKPIWI